MAQEKAMASGSALQKGPSKSDNAWAKFYGKFPYIRKYLWK
jgi:hypothetical protein